MLSMIRYYLQRVSFVVASLNQIGKSLLNGALIASQPTATFYVMADFSSIPSEVAKTDIELQEFFRDMYKNGMDDSRDSCSLMLVV